MDKLGHVKLNGTPYRIDLRSYMGRDVTDFSPRGATPGSGLIFSEMNAYQTLLQNDWRHGFGFEWFSDAAGYGYTEGYVDTRHKSEVRLFSEMQTILTSHGLAVYGVVRAHNGLLVAYGAPTTGNYGIRVSTDGTTWTNVTAFQNKTVNSVWSNGTYTFAAVEGDNRFQKSNAADLLTWTDAGKTTRCIDYKFIAAHDGFVFVGKANTGTKVDGSTYKYKSNQVYYGSLEDLSDLEGSEEDDPQYIPVGPTGEPVIGAMSFNGEMFFFRRDAVYKMTKDRSSAYRVLDFSDQYNTNNFRCRASYNGYMYFNIGNRLYQWNGVRTQDVTPPRMYNTGREFTQFWGMTSVGSYLMAAASTVNSSESFASLLSFDGVGWVNLGPIVLGNYQDQVTSLSFLSDKDFIFINHTVGGSSPYHLKRIDYASDKTNTNLYTLVASSVITSKIDAGFRLVTKSTPSIVIQASSLLVTQQELYVYYKIDSGASWIPWGGTDGGTNRITANGVTILKNPLGSASGQSSIEYKWLELKVTLITNSESVTPVLEGIGIKLILRPETGYGYSFEVIGSKAAEYAMGQMDNGTPYEILQKIRAARDSKKWVEFVDPYGVSHLVYVTSIQEVAVDERVDDIGGDKPNIEQHIKVNLLEIV